MADQLVPLPDLTSIPEPQAGRTWCQAAALGEGWQPCGSCAWCGDPIDKPQIRYCKSGVPGKASECKTSWQENHQPQAPHRATLRRDKGCVRPGCTSPRPDGPSRDSLAGMPYMGLEVNHITPLMEAGGKRLRAQSGCHNHQENLETLCLKHHREVTKAQMKGRAA